MKQIAYISMVLIPAALLLTGCYPRGFRPPASNYEMFTKPGQRVPIEQVKRDLVACGYSAEWSYGYHTDTNPFDFPNSPYSVTDNEEVIGQECMFAKGYVFVDGWGGLCSVPERRSGPRALPNCKDVPIRPRQR